MARKKLWCCSTIKPIYRCFGAMSHKNIAVLAF